MNTTQQILNTAVVGCGAISDIYLENMIHHFDNLNVTACWCKPLRTRENKGRCVWNQRLHLRRDFKRSFY